MNRWTCWNIALLLVALVAVRAPAQDKNDPPKKDETKKEDKKPAPPATPPATPPKTTTFAGEVVHVDSGKGFRLKVPQTYVEINEGEARAALQEQANAQAALARRDPNAARNHLAAAEQHKAKIRQVKTRNKEVNIEATDQAVVRLPGPKESFDEMGNVKKYTAKELDALRGRDKLFPGEFSDLTVGQVVQVTVIVPKAPAKPIKKDDLQLEDSKLEATRIVVVRQPKPK